MEYVIVERNIGRAGNRSQADQKKKIWDQRYGEGKWLTGYDFNGVFITREEAIQVVYLRSYFNLLDSNPNLVNQILEYSDVINPHAYFTNSVDLQAYAVKEYLKKQNLEFKGNRNFLAAGVWQPRNNKQKIFTEALKMGIKNNGDKLIYPSESYKLSPFKVPCSHDNSMSVEEFWQSKYKCLAVLR